MSIPRHPDHGIVSRLVRRLDAARARTLSTPGAPRRRDAQPAAVPTGATGLALDTAISMVSADPLRASAQRVLIEAHLQRAISSGPVAAMTHTGNYCGRNLTWNRARSSPC